MSVQGDQLVDRLAQPFDDLFGALWRLDVRQLPFFSEKSG